jgi:hypothetical protein
MKRERLAFVVTLTYVWALLTLFGGLLFETLIIYPNIFHDVPHSLATAKAFAVVRGPSDFFPPLGALVVATGIGSVLLGWRVRAARLWLLSGLIALVLGDFLTSVLFQWPRNSIMFDEGTAVHSAAFLQQTAREFLAFHWLRLAGIVTAPVLAFIGFLRLYRHRLTSQQQAQPAPVGTPVGERAS